MTETALTCADLYERDDVFRALVNEWVEHRRCPLPLVDRCLDFGLADAAECARWAATTGRRPTYAIPHDGFAEDYPYPRAAWNVVTDQKRFSQNYYWCCRDNGGMAHANEFDSPAMRGGNSPPAVTAGAAILWLLDHWRPIV